MQSKSLAFLAALLPAALADFKVFCGTRCIGFDQGGCGATCIFMNNPASCDDVDSSVNWQIQSDVSGCGGAACDGCDSAGAQPRDWDVTRLEINDSQGCTPSTAHFGGMDDPHFTIYHDGHGDVSIVDTDGNELGHCYVPADRQVVECGGPYGNNNLVNLFDCESHLYLLDSAN